MLRPSRGEEIERKRRSERTDALLQKYAVAYKKYFRFPGLCFDADDVKRVEAENYTVINGDVEGDDGFEKYPAPIVGNVVGHVRAGSIVVLHMHGGPNAPETAITLPDIIRKLRAQGYRSSKCRTCALTATTAATA